MQYYQTRLHGGKYEQLRPRSIRERLDELSYMIYQMVSGQQIDQQAASRIQIGRSRAYGQVRADEEHDEHEQRLAALVSGYANGSSSTALAGGHVSLGLVHVDLIICNSPWWSHGLT